MTKPLGPYTPVVRAGEYVFVSGQLGLGDDGKLVDGGVAAQTTRLLANLSARLDEVGAKLDDVVKTTCFLADMDDYAIFNTSYIEAFGDHRPARSCIAVKALPIGGRVEVEAIAYLASVNEG